MSLCHLTGSLFLTQLVDLGIDFGLQILLLIELVSVRQRSPGSVEEG